LTDLVLEVESIVRKLSSSPKALSSICAWSPAA